MEFQKIKYSEKSGVELVQKIKGEGSVTELREFTCAEPPLAEFPAALKAFVPYVMSLLDLPASWESDLVVTTLSLDEEPKTRRQGLIVTAVIPIEKASNRLLVLNTPRMREAAAETESDELPAGTFGEDIVALIDAAQKAARAYYKGERGQAEMFPAEETTQAVSTPAEGRSDEPLAVTGDSMPVERKKKRGTRTVERGEAGRVWNPEKTQPPTDDVIRSKLLLAGYDVPTPRIGAWTATERDRAARWADQVVAAKNGEEAIDWKKEPLCVSFFRDVTGMQGNGAPQEATATAAT